MADSLKDSVYLQREWLARMLHQPMARLAEACIAGWDDREQINTLLRSGAGSIPHCAQIYCLDQAGMQISDSINADGVVPGYFGRDRSHRPYMQETVPNWGFLLSDAYISLSSHRLSLTALQVVRRGEQALGFLGADFDLRDLPAQNEMYQEPGSWRQVKGDPAIRSTLFQQCRVDSPMDQSREQSLAILEELLTLRGVFQCLIHFSSSQATIWTVDDPYRYRILDNEALSDPDICLAYPPKPYPQEAMMPQTSIVQILSALAHLRTADENIYLRMSSLNIFNGMVSLTFSCDGSHYMRYDEFLEKNLAFWFGSAA